MFSHNFSTIIIDTEKLIIKYVVFGGIILEYISYYIAVYFLEGIFSLSPNFTYCDGWESVIYAVIMFFLGGALASFSCVLAERIPSRKKWWGKERSHCNECGKQLVWYELIPVLSYIFLRGKCHKCGAVIPSCYFKAELASGIFLAASYLTFGFSFGCLISIFLTPFFDFHYITDIKNMILYDEITAGIAVAAICYRLHISMIASDYTLLYSGFIAGLMAILISYPLSIMGWFGSGDTLLYGALAILLGKYLVIPIFFIAACVGLVSIAFNWVTGFILKGDKKIPQIIPYGPALCMAASLIWLFSPYR